MLGQVRSDGQRRGSQFAISTWGEDPVACAAVGNGRSMAQVRLILQADRHAAPVLGLCAEAKLGPSEVGAHTENRPVDRGSTRGVALVANDGGAVPRKPLPWRRERLSRASAVRRAASAVASKVVLSPDPGTISVIRLAGNAVVRLVVRVDGTCMDQGSNSANSAALR